MTVSSRRHGVSRRPGRAAFTLVEVLISMSLTVILMGALTSVILITSRAIDTGQGPALAAAQAGNAFNDMAADLKLAVSFDEAERTATSVRFTVPDRDDDGQLETIHYAWSGAAGDPLTRACNDADPGVVAENVHHLDLSYEVTVINGTGGTSAGVTARELTVLLIVEKPSELKALETTRMFLIESWGHDVTIIDDDAIQADYDEAFGTHDLVYVPENVRHNDLGERLRDASIGIVLEHKQLPELLDLSEDQPGSTNSASIIVDDNTHYITRPYFAGLLPIMTDNQGTLHFDKPLAIGATGLAHLPDKPGEPVLVVLEAGAAGYSGSPIPARRVVLPWGDGFEFLSETGRTVMRRALEWAANAEVAGELLSTPLFSQHEDPSVGDSDHEVKHDKWAVASIVPALPADAVAWTPTRFRFMGKQKGDPLSTLTFQVRGRGFDGSPTSLVLDQTTMPESALPLEYDWVEVTFSMSDPLPPEEGICIAVGTTAGSGAAHVLYEGGFGVATEANQFWWGDQGDWDTNVDRDIPCELEGSVETEGP